MALYVKTFFNKFISILDIAKKRISILEDRSTQTIQTKILWQKDAKGGW